jgi:hypothetical protein
LQDMVNSYHILWFNLNKNHVTGMPHGFPVL